MIRYLWVDEGSSPDYVKGDKEGINGYFLSIREATKANLQAISQRNLACGVYLAYNDSWLEFYGLSGKELAEKVHAMLQLLSWSTVSKPKVQFDLEMQNPTLIGDCLTHFRKLQPSRDVSWTMEGHQGGWMTPSFVSRIRLAKVRVVPQCYDAPMENVWDTLEMARDLMRKGFADSMISPFHDAAKLPKWWQGFAFTQARLPG